MQIIIVQVLSKLQEVVLRSDDESDSIDAKLNTMSTDLHTLINNTIQVIHFTV